MKFATATALLACYLHAATSSAMGDGTNLPLHDKKDGNPRLVNRRTSEKKKGPDHSKQRSFYQRGNIFPPHKDEKQPVKEEASGKVGTPNGDEQKTEVEIINGNPVTAGTYPWFVRFVLTNNGTDYWGGCGGSLVTPEYVLTAAHCVYYDYVYPPLFNDVSQVIAEIGALCVEEIDGAITDDNCEQDAERIEAKEITIHPGSRSNDDFSQDFALIRLARPSNIEPVPMDDGEFSPKYDNGKKLWTAGFGRTDYYYSDLPTQLMRTELEYIDNEICRAHFYWLKLHPEVTSDMMCAYDFGEEFSTACNGDSGGPLFDSENNVLAGIVSWGIRGCGGATPEVFSRIADEWAWIKNTICEGHSENNKPDFCTGCSGDDIAVKVTIRPDDYPHETYFSLGSPYSKKFVAGFSAGLPLVTPLEEPFKVRTFEYCLPCGSYDFAVYDYYGDGISDPGYAQISITTSSDDVNEETFSGVFIVAGKLFRASDLGCSDGGEEMMKSKKKKDKKNKRLLRENA